MVGKGQPTVEKFPDELQFFEPPVTQSVLEGSYTMEILPINPSINNTDVIEFIIPATENYLDLADVLLYMRCKILGKDATKPLGKIQTKTTGIKRTVSDTPLVRQPRSVDRNPPVEGSGTDLTPAANTSNLTPDQSRIITGGAGNNIQATPPVTLTTALALDDPLGNPAVLALLAALEPTERDYYINMLTVKGIRDAAPVNLLFFMCFERCEVQINGTPFITSYNNYGYKGYFVTLLNYSRGVKKNLLRNILWKKDKIDVTRPDKSMDHVNLLYPENNQGLADRYEITKEGKPFEMIGRIMHELFLIENYLLPDISIKIRLFKRNPSFFLMSAVTAPDYFLNMLDMKLLTRFVKVNSKTHDHVHKRLASSPAIYKIYAATDVRTRALVPGSRQYTLDNFFGSEKVSNRIVFAMVTHDAFLGSCQKNPLNFQHFNLEEITLVVDNQIYSYKMDFLNGEYAVLYTALACQLGNRDFACSSDTSYVDLRYGTSIFPFDLTPNHNTDDIQTEKRQFARLELKFSKTLAEPVELLYFSEQPRVFQIDKSKKFTSVL